MKEIKNVVLEIPDHKYKFLTDTLDSLKSGIRILGINPVYKQSLMRDIHTVNSIIQTTKKEGLS